jgi:UV DNA damage endonuclease
VGVLNTNQKTCRQKYASEEKLQEIIRHNLNSLDNIIDYNISNNIHLFRISSDIIPFGSSPVNTLKWWELFESDILKISEKIKSNNIRVSMHPGQYTVLNSPHEDVVDRAVKDLNYHVLFLESLGLNEEHKIILHIGGVYNNKPEAMERFMVNYKELSYLIKQRLVLENDDKSYNIGEVINIGQQLNAPVVFDNLHNSLNPSKESKSEEIWIKECNKTWKLKDGCQKIHYSQQDLGKRAGSHSSSIRLEEFVDFYKRVDGVNLDIMLEVKDKNISAVNCIKQISLI